MRLAVVELQALLGGETGAAPLDLAAERLDAGVRQHVDLQVGLVLEGSPALLAGHAGGGVWLLLLLLLSVGGSSGKADCAVVPAAVAAAAGPAVVASGV